MGLNLGGIFGGVSTILGGNQNPYFQGASQVFDLASAITTRQPGVPAPVPRGTVPGTAGAMRSVPAIGRKFFEKFPNLATAMQALRNRGADVSRSKLYSLLKRFGPEILITGGLLTAAAISELMVAGSGRKRMNPGNVKALRRSMRRVEAFHKICVRADTLRRPRSRSKPCKTSGSQFVRQG